MWSELGTEEILSRAAVNTVQPNIMYGSPSNMEKLAAGLDPKLLYDYRCRLLHMVKEHYGERRRALTGQTGALTGQTGC